MLPLTWAEDVLSTAARAARLRNTREDAIAISFTPLPADAAILQAASSRSQVGAGVRRRTAPAPAVACQPLNVPAAVPGTPYTLLHTVQT